MFDRRKAAADKLKDCIRERGYTKASFSQMTGIPKQEIEKLLNAEMGNRYTFEKYIKMILTALNLSAENLMLFSIQKSVLSCPASGSFDLQMNEKTKKQYNLLWDIMDLCMIYYDDVTVPLTILDKRELSGGVILPGKIDKFGKLHITP